MTRGFAYRPAHFDPANADVVGPGDQKDAGEAMALARDVHEPMRGVLNAVLLGTALWTLLLIAVLAF
jgi:hypothetical protein